MRILSMKCASCAAPLEIKPETKEFVCAYCGSAQIVDRSGGTVTLKLAEEALGKVQRGTDRTASELALARLKDELRQIPYPDFYLEPPHPRKPEMERPKWYSSCHPAYRSIVNDYWDSYEKEMLIYDKEMLDWPSQEKHNETLQADFVKKQKAIEAEMAIHEAIVKRG